MTKATVKDKTHQRTCTPVSPASSNCRQGWLVVVRNAVTVCYGATVRRCCLSLHCHHGCGQHTLGRVLYRNHPIAIHHAMLTYGIAAIRRGQRSCNYRCRKADVSRNPLFAAVYRIRHSPITHHPADLPVREFDIGFTFGLAADSCPGPSSVDGPKQLPIKSAKHASVRIEASISKRAIRLHPMSKNSSGLVSASANYLPNWRGRRRHELSN